MPRIPAIRTLHDIFTYGWRLRVWCFRCARGSDFDIDTVLDMFERNHWPSDIEAARTRFRCQECHMVDQILLVPARRPVAPPPRTWEQEVVRWFHDNRAAAKSAHREASRRQHWSV